MKVTVFPRIDRYELLHYVEKDTFNKDADFYYIRDNTKGKHGKIIARFYALGEAELSLEYLNQKKKIRKRRIV